MYNEKMVRDALLIDRGSKPQAKTYMKGNRFSPRTFRKEFSPANALVLDLRD